VAVVHMWPLRLALPPVTPAVFCGIANIIRLQELERTYYIPGSTTGIIDSYFIDSEVYSARAIPPPPIPHPPQTLDLLNGITLVSPYARTDSDALLSFPRKISHRAVPNA